MCFDERIGGVEAWVGDAIDSDASVIAFHIFGEPLGRVVGVGAFVNVFVGLSVGDDGADIYKFTFRHPPAAHVLEDENIALPRQVHILKTFWVHVFTIRCDGVGCPFEQHRIFFGQIFRCINGREKANTIAHGDVRFAFRVIVPNESGIGFGRCLGKERLREQKKSEDS